MLDIRRIKENPDEIKNGLHGDSSLRTYLYRGNISQISATVA